MANESRSITRRNQGEGSMFRPFSTGAMLRPFALLREMTDWMDQTFEGDLPITHGERMWAPAVEICERGNNVIVSADLPGIEPKDVKIEIDNNTLVIQGERKHEERRQDEGFRRTERFYGTFFRAIPLPETAKLDDAKAEFRNGVLEITVPVSQEQSQRKQIPIQGASQSTQRQVGQGQTSQERSSQERSSQESQRQPETTGSRR
ncbi:MAG TPA: Hsp20/alpha crystallin family protein [Bryobacteraceae bacterium]|jgi:HSP20 family protein|nr:Hsp20/alpha crystallin family protein [Bryobacteraceae bacterium]